VFSLLIVIAFSFMLFRYTKLPAIADAIMISLSSVINILSADSSLNLLEFIILFLFASTSKRPLLFATKIVLALGFLILIAN